MPKVGDGTGMDKKYAGPVDGGTHLGGDSPETPGGAVGRAFDSKGAMHDGPQRTSFAHGNKTGGGESSSD